jgi:hypothetical protein
MKTQDFLANLPGEARLGLSLGMILILSMNKKMSCKTNLLVSVLILWITYGVKNTVFYLFSVLINLFLLKMLGLNQYVFTILNISNLCIYKTFAKWIDHRIGGTFDISGILMILTVKMGYLSMEFQGDFNSALDYVFFIPGLVTGPIMPYRIFLLQNTKLNDVKGSVIDKSKPNRFPWFAMLKTLLFLAIYGIGKSFQFLDYFLIKDQSFFKKIAFLYLYNVTGRSKFHFAWNFAHVCFSLQDFPDFLNINFGHVEYPESIANISQGWNKFISLWLKTMFFNPLKSKSMILAVGITYLVSGTLHGINPCYLIFSFSFGIYRKTIDRANKAIKYKIIRQIQMILFIMYFSMPFYLLDIPLLFKVWKNVYFYGHVYCTFWLLVMVYEMNFKKNQPVQDQVQNIKNKNE